MKRALTIFGGFAGGVIASYLFDFMFDKQGVASSEVLMLIGGIPGLLAGFVLAFSSKYHQWKLGKNVMLAMDTVLICMAVFALYQYFFTSAITGVALTAYFAFLFVMSLFIGAAAGLSVWITNRLC